MKNYQMCFFNESDNKSNVFVKYWRKRPGRNDPDSPFFSTELLTTCQGTQSALRRVRSIYKKSEHRWQYFRTFYARRFPEWFNFKYLKYLAYL